MTSNKFFRVQFDLFGQPIEYKTTEARARNLYSLCAKLWSLHLLNLPSGVWYYHIVSLVQNGYLSLRSASYFLSGRTSKELNDFLLKFIHFERLFGLQSTSKVISLWQKQENVVPENTFLFPLAELASKDEDFASEREHYLDNNALDLKEI